MERKCAVIITGGYAPCSETIKAYTERADYVIAADSGYDIALSCNVRVNYVIGDMDSIKNRAKLSDVPAENKMIVSHEKDETDTELALDKVWGLGFREIVLIGGGGGRLDHIIGILWLFEREKSPDLWVTDHETVVKVEGTFSCATEKGERISLFPLSDIIQELDSEGLKWNIGGLSWKRGDMGISNEATGNSIRITVDGGKLLMIRENKQGVAYV